MSESAEIKAVQAAERLECAKAICKLCDRYGIPERAANEQWTHRETSYWFWGNCLAAAIWENAHLKENVSKETI